MGSEISGDDGESDDGLDQGVGGGSVVPYVVGPAAARAEKETKWARGLLRQWLGKSIRQYGYITVP